MQSLENRLIFSATDLSNFLACPHLILLKRRTALGGPKPRVFADPGVEVLRRRGLEHEQNFLAGLQEGGALRIVDLTSSSSGPHGLERLERHAGATLEAMHDGADVIYQGLLFDEDWIGYPDFLRKVPRPGTLGDWSYEVVDTKLAREARGGALLQVLLYAELLKAVQGVAPDSVHLALGGPAAPLQSFRVIHYAAYFRSIRKRFLDWVAAAPAELPLAVDPVPHCEICEWDYSCTRERRDVDHLLRRRHHPAAAPRAGGTGSRNPGSAGRALLRPGGRPLRLRAGDRVPVRRCRRQGRVHRPLVARSAQGAGDLRVVHGLRHEPPPGVPGPARVPLRLLRAGGVEAPGGPLRCPHRRAGPAPSREGLRRSVPGGPAGAPGVGPPGTDRRRPS